ncbi:hypothetical protein OAO01_08795 [Oligoflexia bacterium]|nr:hypothetical protein [Oligoflexia bacterium]
MYKLGNLIGGDEEHKKNSFFLVLLAIIFLVSFAAPIIFGVSYSTFFSPADEDVVESDKLFPDAVSVPGPGTYLRVHAAKGLDPEAEKDFLFLVWLNLKKFPDVGEKIALVAKFDVSTPTRTGYTIGIARGEDSIYPILHWQNRAGTGGSYRFSDMRFLPKTWVMLAVTLQKGKFLGMHSAMVSEGTVPQLELLGGYELEPAVVPSSESGLVLGALSSGLFRGKLGPFGIFSGDNIIEELEDTLQQFLKEPLELPTAFSDKEVMLWSIDGVTDLSQNAHTIEAKGAVWTHKKKKKGKKGRRLSPNS